MPSRDSPPPAAAAPYRTVAVYATAEAAKARQLGMWRKLRRAARVCSAIWGRISNRLKSPDCLLCMFTCAFVYVLCFIFILAIVIRGSGGSLSGQSGRATMLFRMKDTAAEAAAAAAENAGLASNDDAGNDENRGAASAGTFASVGVGGGKPSSGGGGEVLYERKSVDDVFIEESVFEESPGDRDSGHLLGPEVLTETGRLHGYGSQDFRYPLNVDMLELLARLRSGQAVSVSPINQLDSPWLIRHSGDCNSSEPLLLLLVKSHPANVANRDAIRRTWARPECWRRPVRLYFLLGADAAYGVRRGRRILRRVRDWRSALKQEDKLHRDLLVREFVDHYFNNTLKLMSGVQWSEAECPTARFTAFVDDDFFVNPFQVERQLDSVSAAVYARFLGGYVWRTSLPRRRTRQHRSKWDISISEYQWETYPPYVAAGAMFMSRPVLNDIAVAMKYTRYLRFDDIFIGLVAHKLLLSPLHMEMVHAYEPVLANSTDKPALLRLVASHGYKSPADIATMWQRLHLDGLCLLKPDSRNNRT